MGRPVHDFRLLLSPEDTGGGSYKVELYAVGDKPSSDEWVVTQPDCAFDRGAWDRRWPFLPEAEDALREFGRELAALLLPEEVRAQFLGKLIKEGGAALSPVRLRLTNKNPDFDDLPWEYLYFDGSPMRPDLNGFLCLESPCFHLVRQAEERHAVTPIPFEKLRVLIAWADPHSDLPAIRAEIESIQNTLKRPARFDLREPLDCATPGMLMRAIADFRPNVLYFTGHGTRRKDGALIVGDDKNEILVTGEQLSEWLDPKTTALVVLSACDTEPVARTLTRAGIPAVVAMQRPMPADLSAAFASVFWAALAEPCALEEAVHRVRQATKESERHYWGVPTLYLAGHHSDLFRRVKPPPHNLPFEFNRHYRDRKLLPDGQAACDGKGISDRPWLHARLERPESRPVPVVITGMTGAGKTQLASQYAQEYLLAYPGGVYWINAHDSLRLQNDLVEIGREFFARDIPGDLLSPNYAKCVIRHLQEMPERALLIYDNLTPETLFLRPTTGNCRILATTHQDKKIPEGFERLNLRPELEPESAAELLQIFGKAVGETETEAVVGIAADLGYLPLALTLAAHHIQELGMGFAYYRERLKKGLPETLARAKEQFELTTGHKGNLFDTILHSFCAASPLAQSILAVACCFASKGISRALLCKACLACFGSHCSEDDFGDALRELRRWHLILYAEVGEEKEAVGSRQRFAGERLSVHELVRQAVRFSRPPEARPGFPEILGHVARVLADCLHQANSAENWQSIGPEIAHCRHVESLCQAGHTDSYFELLLGLGVFYCEHWEAHIGLGYLQRGWELVRAQQGEENLLAAQFLRQLADAHRKLSEFPKARMLAEQATSLAAKVLPGRHPDLAEYYGTTGLICKFQADELKSDAEKQQRLAHYKEAERYYQEALQLLEPVKAERPGEYAMYLSNIGLIHEALGDPDSALDYVLRAFLIIRRPLGVHRKVAVRLNNIGRILRQQVRAFDEQGSLRCKQKKLQQALRFHQRAQRIYKDILDHEQLDSAYTHYYLGETHYEMQQKDSAAQAYLRALPLFKRYGREALCEAIELRLREIEDETRIPREERPDQQSFEQVEPERPMLWM